MKTRLDKFGRVILPKEIRDDLGLSAGDAMEVRETSGGILLTLAAGSDTDSLRVVDGVLVFDGVAIAGIEGAVKQDRDARTKKLSGRLSGRRSGARHAPKARRT